MQPAAARKREYIKASEKQVFRVESSRVDWQVLVEGKKEEEG